jgi:hypothetical protein
MRWQLVDRVRSRVVAILLGLAEQWCRYCQEMRTTVARSISDIGFLKDCQMYNVYKV